MKKQEILNLIRYHAENNDAAFRTTAYNVAKEFDQTGDSQLAEYIMAALSSADTLVPQAYSGDLRFMKQVPIDSTTLPLPDGIKSDIVGLMNAIRRNVNINRFLFQGQPGTGKTESVKQIARILDRTLYQVTIDELIDSRLGETAKNITTLFSEINQLSQPNKVVVLFDELDSLALERTGNHDVREMGRATTAVLKGLDNLNGQVVLIATTNLFSSFDKALLRRFNSVIDFNRYSQNDLMEIADIILNATLNKFPNVGRNINLFRKIMGLMPELPYPGDLKNLIETSVAFSDPDEKFDYLLRLYHGVTTQKVNDFKALESEGFTLREMALLSGVSRSTISRELRS